MPKTCILRGDYTGPTSLGDILVEFSCQRRGKFTVAIDPRSACVELVEDEDGLGSEPKSEEPMKLPDGEPDREWTMDELRAYCDAYKIKYHHLNKRETLMKLIEKRKREAVLT